MLLLNGKYRGVITSDEHVPFHDPKALALVNKVAKWWGPNIWLLAGDQLDCYDLSTFTKEAEVGVDFQTEVDMWHNEVLGPQMKAAEQAQFVKIDGNHEDRFPKYIGKSEGIKDLRAIRMENVLELGRLGVTYAPQGVILNQSLLTTHGENAAKWSGSSVRAAMEEYRYQYSVVVGHAHRQGRVPVRVGDRWVIGQENPCLCSLNPGYATAVDWMLGFTLFISGPSHSHTIPVQIMEDYTCYIGDKLFSL